MARVYSERFCVLWVLPVLALASTTLGYQGKFWQITDIHWDLQYSEHGNPVKMCHKAYDGDAKVSRWGDYHCDSPWPLVQSAIHAMVEIEPQPDFVLWTGDNAPHTDDPEPDFPVIFRTISNITEELRMSFPLSVPILPVLGNHDSFPKDDYPVGHREFYARYLNEGSWSMLLPVEAQQEFEQGGYYSYKLASGVTVLVVNTNLYYAFNELGVNVPDPCGQFAWLRSKLETAKKENSKVIIAAHAPPGFFERLALVPFFNETYNTAYVDLLNNFGPNIMVQIYGHEHTDSFKLFIGPKDEVESVALLAPSVTPWQPSPEFGGTAINPSLRLYQYTPSAIQDYSQYHLNLTKVITPAGDVKTTNNETFPEPAPIWELFYKARETYGLESLEAANMAKLYDKLLNNDTVFQNYYLINSAGYDNGLCNSPCKKSHLCAIRYIKINDVFRCMEYNSKFHILSHEYMMNIEKNLKDRLHQANVYWVVIGLVVVSMVLTIVMAVLVAIMLILLIKKRNARIPTETNITIFDFANSKQNYHKLP